VKARVANLEDVPRHIVLSEVEGFLGQSWTIQCEIISQMSLGAQPGDEDPALDDDQLDQNPPLTSFISGSQCIHNFFSRKWMRMNSKMTKIGVSGLQEPLM
jgi:hypothetical protein